MDVAQQQQQRSETRSPRRRRGVAVLVIVVVAGLVAALAVTVTRRGGDGATATRASTVPTTAGTGATPTDRTTAPPGGASATDDLAPFFAAATAMDRRLHAAADAINASGPPWAGVSDELASTVRAADIGPVAAAPPAGLPPDLLGAVILVHSDLSSRRAAVETFASPRTPQELESRDLLAELSLGHAAADRFEADLAAARALAARSPAIAPAATDSREAAELAVLLAYVHQANWGCDSRGGAVVTPLPPIEWQSGTTGTVGAAPVAIGFTVRPAADGGWTARLDAC